MLIVPTNLVCLLFSTAIPTSHYKFKQLFFILVTNNTTPGYVGRFLAAAFNYIIQQYREFWLKMIL